MLRTFILCSAYIIVTRAVTLFVYSRFSLNVLGIVHVLGGRVAKKIRKGLAKYFGGGVANNFLEGRVVKCFGYGVAKIYTRREVTRHQTAILHSFTILGVVPGRK